MRLICPVPEDGDIIPFIQRGVAEFYFGFSPDFWKKDYSMLSSINRRYSPQEQIRSAREALAVLRVCHRSASRCFLALNAPLYQTRQIGAILDFLRSWQSTGLTGVIVSDMGLILALRKELKNLEIHASCGTVCLNSQSLAFFHGLGVQRIILPRSVSLKEILSMTRNKPPVELEVFARPETCTNIDGLCTHWHNQNLKFSACFLEEKFLSFCPSPRSSDTNMCLYQLLRSGVDAVKIPREGLTTGQFLKKYGGIMRVIQLFKNRDRRRDGKMA
jgi:putative protease